MTFQQLEASIDDYLLIADRGIVKMLCATVIANRITSFDSTWVYVVAPSSAGKTELLQALSYARGLKELDDLTGKTFISGAKAGGTETSLLYKLGEDPILVFKDLTVLLEKDKKEGSVIFSQLRLIYDGKLYKTFGTGEEIRVKIRMGLIAGTTDAIEGTDAQQASMGQRALRYYMNQPDRHEVATRAMMGKNEKEKREIIGECFRLFLDETVVVPEELPELPVEICKDLIDLAEMATLSRSGVSRDEFSRDKNITRGGLAEMPARFGKQLKNLGISLMVINKGPLTGLDLNILYKIALDSIPSGRRAVMTAATKHSQITLEGLANEMGIPEDSAKIFLEDLIYYKVMSRHGGRAQGQKFYYSLRESYRNIIEKFGNIPMTDEVLEDENI